MNECCSDRIAASIVTLLTIGSSVELKLPHAAGRALTRWRDADEVVGDQAERRRRVPSTCVMFASVERARRPSGVMITSLAAAIVSDLEYVPLT